MLILLVDDERTYTQVMGEYLRSHGYRVITAPTALHALQRLRESSQRVDVLLSDERMPRGGSGVLLLECVASSYPSVALVLLSGAPSADAIFRATAVGATVITKGALIELLEHLREVESRINSAIHDRPDGSDPGGCAEDSSVATRD